MDNDIGEILNELPDATFSDAEAERQFRLVEEIVVEELNARLEVGDTTDTQQAVRGERENERPSALQERLGLPETVRTRAAAARPDA